MDQGKLRFVLLLPLCLCLHSEETLVKTIEREPDVTPICTNETLNIVTRIVCNIRTERNGREECRLLYQQGQDFVHECDSRFTLMTESQTAFLHLTRLTPEDSGKYTCECSRVGGSHTLHINIIVKGERSTSPMTMILSIAVIASATSLLIVTGFVLWLILRTNYCRNPASSGPSVYETSCSLDKGDADNLYTGLQQTSSDLYQSVSSAQHQHNGVTNNNMTNHTATVRLDQETDGRGTDQGCEIYENI